MLWVTCMAPLSLEGNEYSANALLEICCVCVCPCWWHKASELQWDSLPGIRAILRGIRNSIVPAILHVIAAQQACSTKWKLTWNNPLRHHRIRFKRLPSKSFCWVFYKGSRTRRCTLDMIDDINYILRPSLPKILKLWVKMRQGTSTQPTPPSPLSQHKIG